MSENGNAINDKRHFPLRIERMPDGGFVVGDTGFMGGGDQSRFCSTLFASSSIYEALAFIMGRLDPEGFKAYQEVERRAAAAKEELSRAFAKPREASGVRLCGICKSSGMGRYCSRPNCTERGLGSDD